MTVEQWREIEWACHQLGKSARGRATLVALLAWINEAAAPGAARPGRAAKGDRWRVERQRGSTRDAMLEVLEDNQ